MHAHLDNVKIPSHAHLPARQRGKRHLEIPLMELFGETQYIPPGSNADKSNYGIAPTFLNSPVIYFH